MKKKIVIFGCQGIAIDIIRFLNRRNDIELSLVVTYEIIADLIRGQRSVIEFSKKLKLKTLNPKKIDNELIEIIKKIKPDLIISCYYRKIFPKNLIKLPKQGIINIHPSLLPEFRGPVPTAWAIYNDKKETGVTIHNVDGGIDTGDVLVQSKIRIRNNETGYQLYRRAMKEGYNLFRRNFNKILNSKIKPKPQKSGGSYYGKLNISSRIDWKSNAITIKNLIRIYAQPFLPAVTRIENKYLFINKCSVYKNKKLIVQAPGKIIKIYNLKKILVSCSDGAVIIEDFHFYPPLNKIEEKYLLRVGALFF
tara:strand:+ start:3853 stop:4773 length:921 start_codon:yes stop_codon:yes gene_type:complete